LTSSQSINILKNAPSVASTVGQNIAFLAANGAVPWLNTLSTAVKPSVTQRYQNKAAPHIIFFLVDDWGYNDCGYQSSWLNWTTLNIDKLMQACTNITVPVGDSQMHCLISNVLCAVSAVYLLLFCLPSEHTTSVHNI